MNGVESQTPVANDRPAEFSETPPPSKVHRVARVAYKTLLWLFAILLVLIFVPIFLPGAAFMIEIPFLLVFGWIGFLGDIVESAELNYALIIEGAVVVVALAVGGHYFARWLYRALFPAASEPWQARWTAGGLGLVLLLFVAGIATIGLTHQTAWLFMRTDPIIWSSIRVWLNIHTGADLANAHRRALIIECSEGRMTAGTGHERLGLDAPEVYQNDRYVHSVTARVIDEVTATVIIVYREIHSAIPDGATVVYTGTCQDGKIIWSVDGTVPKRYQPRI